MVPNTYSQVYIHLVFAVSQRENLISTKFRSQLYAYIAGILQKMGCYPLAIGGTGNHIHIFFDQKIDLSISEIIRDIKSNSTKWINENKFVLGKFAWQRGAGVFSHSKNNKDQIIKYIQTQEEHHRKCSFRDEYLAILNKLEIKYSDDYLFEW